MARTIRIAAAQIPISSDPVVNARAIRALMTAAAKQGARLVHFPEGAVSGYPSDGAEADFAGWHVDWTDLRGQVESIARLAGELGVWTVAGCNHRLTPPHRPHNSLYVISDDGTLVDRYDKRMCSETEIAEWYVPGFQPCLFEVGGFRFGCALCAEISYPEIFLDYAERGADCVLFSSFSKDPTFEVLARGAAAANSMWVSASVASQHAVAMPAGVLGPDGSWMAACARDRIPGIVCVDLDRDDPRMDRALRQWRPWRAAVRSGQVYQARRVEDPRSSERTAF